MDLLAQALLHGLTYGFLLFMLAAGLTLVFSLMGVMNFAHASLYMLGAYVGASLAAALGFGAALVLAPLAVGLGGAALERWLLRPLHARGHVAELLFTFGLAFLIEEAVKLVWGTGAVEFRFPPALDAPLLQVLGSPYPAYKGFMVMVALAALALLYGLIAFTRVGLVVRAALQHPQMVGNLGHDVDRVFMLVFGLGSALAALAGVIGGAALTTEPSMAAQLGTIVFVVVVIGGLGSITGAFVAAMGVGLLQTLMVAVDLRLAQLLPQSLNGLAAAGAAPAAALGALKVSQLAPMMPYALMVAMLLLRPRGLFGQRDA
jgi:branched-chain amino acid transport system permease protein